MNNEYIKRERERENSYKSHIIFNENIVSIYISYTFPKGFMS